MSKAKLNVSILSEAISLVINNGNSETKAFFDAITDLAGQTDKESLAESLNVVDGLFETATAKASKGKDAETGKSIANRLRLYKMRSRQGLTMLVKHNSKAKSLGGLAAAYKTKYGKKSEADTGPNVFDLVGELYANSDSATTLKAKAALLDAFLANEKVIKIGSAFNRKNSK